MVDLAEKISLAPTTTVEQDRHTKAARFTDFIWEITQGIIALTVVLSVIYTNARLALWGVTTSEVSNAALMQLNVLGGIIVGFYFGRTNHSRRGGLVSKSE